MSRYRVTHRTTYRYAEPVPLCHNEAHLRPRSWEHQTLLSYELSINPFPATVGERLDFFGNNVHYFAIEQMHKSLEVLSFAEVDVTWPERIYSPDSFPWQETLTQLRNRTDDEAILARSFVLESPLVPSYPELFQFAHRSFDGNGNLLDAVRDLVARIFHDFTFDPESTTISTPLTEVMAQRRGVCQDFAHLLIGCLRSHGVPARYVSGYIETHPPEDGQRLVGADASHAWVSVYIPSLGWIDVDPTNNLLPVTSHVTIGWGRDYGDVPPLKGVIVGGGKHTLKVAVDVQRLGDPAPVS